MSDIPPKLRKPFYFVLIATAMTIVFYVTFYNVNRRWKPIPLRPQPLIWPKCDSVPVGNLNLFYSPLWRGACDAALDSFHPPFWLRYYGPNDSAALRRLEILVKQGMDEAYDFEMSPADVLDFALVSFRVTFGVRRWLPYFDRDDGRAWLMWNPLADDSGTVARASGAGWEAVRILVDSSLMIYAVKDWQPFSGERVEVLERLLREADWRTPAAWTVIIPGLSTHVRRMVMMGHVRTEYQALIELTAYYQPFAVKKTLRGLRKKMKMIDRYGPGTLLMMALPGGKVVAALRMARIDRWHP